MMSDFEEDDFPYNEDQTVIIAKKLKAMFENIKRVVDVDLMTFTADELEVLETAYGSGLVYPIYPEIDKLLSAPETSKLIH